MDPDIIVQMLIQCGMLIETEILRAVPHLTDLHVDAVDFGRTSTKYKESLWQWLVMKVRHGGNSWRLSISSKPSGDVFHAAVLCPEARHLITSTLLTSRAGCEA
jgi:hypothetical protein